MSLVEHTHADGVHRIVLNRPDAGNALSLELTRAYREALEAASAAGAAVVVISANGRFFSVGGDLKVFAAAGTGLPAVAAEVIAELHRAQTVVHEMAAPVVVVVQGAAAGAGVSLALAGDIVLAAENVTFNMAYAAVGVSPDGGATWSLPRLVGPRQAANMTLLNQPVKAPRAVEIGLVNEAVPADALEARTEEIVARLTSLPAAALASTKRLLRSAYETDLGVQLEREAAAFLAACATSETQGLIAAFVNR